MEENEGRFLTESDVRLEVQERPVYRTERGFVLPPGITPWYEYQKTQMMPMWHADHALQRRVRTMPGTKERFIVSENPEDRMLFEKERMRFAQDTDIVVQYLKEMLGLSGVDVLINGRSKKHLRAWERKLPQLALGCFPLFLRSGLPIHQLPRMKPRVHASECLMHFDSAGTLQLVRWHSNVNAEVLSRSQAIGSGVFADRERVSEAYTRKDFPAVSAIVAKHISQAILRFP